MNGWIQIYVTHIKYQICDPREIDWRICVRIIGNTMITYWYILSDSILLQATEMYLSYVTLLNQKNIRYIYYSQI